MNDVEVVESVGEFVDIDVDVAVVVGVVSIEIDTTAIELLESHAGLKSLA